MELTLSSYYSYLVLLSVTVVHLLYFFCLRQHDPRKQPHAHGLRAYPIVGTLPHFVKNQHRLLQWLTGVIQGSPTNTMSFKMLGLAGGVITADPANVEHILKTNIANYPKGEVPMSMLQDFLGHGIFNSDGEQWLWQRKAASYEFNRRSLRNFVVEAVRFEVVERLLPLLERSTARNQTLEMQDVLERFAFDSICLVAFDEDPACLAEEESPRNAEFMHAFKDAQTAIMARFMSPAKWLWRVKRRLNMEPERQMRSALATIHDYADKIVRERTKRGQAGTARRDDLLSRFAASGEHSDESLRYVVTNFILAGRDTISSAMTWLFWLVSTRPDVEDKILREIQAVRAKAAGGATTTMPLGFDELREMQYLHAAVTESLRLYPPVPMDTHHTKDDDFLPDGTFVGKGWEMSYSSYVMARLEDIWGKDCEEFKPERWLDEEGAFRPESPFKYPVFHAGPRVCLGKEMAYLQIKSVMASVLERFSLRYVGGEGHPEAQLSMTLRMGGGLPMLVKHRATRAG